MAFAAWAELEACRARCGDEWDDEEFYVVAGEIKRKIMGVRFERISHCAGIMTIENMTCRMMTEEDIDRVVPLNGEKYGTTGTDKEDPQPRKGTALII